MAEKKPIEYCRYYKGEDSYSEAEAKKNRFYMYFWEGERRFVYDEVSEKNVSNLYDAGLQDFDSSIPQKLLASLFSCVIHLYSSEDIEFRAEVFVTEFYPSYVKRSV